MTGQSFYILILLPLLAASLSLVFRTKKELTSYISIVISFIYFSFTLYTLIFKEYGYQSVAGSWPAVIGISLKYDLFSNMMLAVVSSIYFAGSLYNVTGKTVERDQNFQFLYNSLFLGLSGAFLTQDLFNLFVWFEVTLMSSYVLVILGRKRERLYSGLKYIIMNFLSGMLFLMSVGFVYQTTKTLDFVQLQQRLSEVYTTDPGLVRAIALSLFTAFAIKSAFFPLFFWLPESYPKLSPGLSGVFAGLLTKLGLYAMIRVFGQVFPSDNLFFIIVLILSVLTLLVGVWGAVVQTKIREILSFHVISQVGFIGVGVSFSIHPSPEIRKFAIACAVFYIIHHIVVKANLYFVSGIVNSLKGTEDIVNLSGLFRSKPFLAILFLIPALSLIGIPPFSGFWAKVGMFRLAIMDYQIWVAICMIAGSFFTLYSMIKIWDGVFWGDFLNADDETEHSYETRSLRPWLASVFLGLITLFISLSPNWVYRLAIEVGNKGLDL